MDRQNSVYILSDLPQDAQTAIKFVVDKLINEIWPLVINIRKSLHSQACVEESEKKVVNDVFTLCCSQVKKCILNLFDVLKLEYHQKVLLQESRHCTLERLSWCINCLISIQRILGSSNLDCAMDGDSDDSLFASPTYFVNWLDHAFEVLSNLSDAVYETDYEDSPEQYETWKSELVNYVGELHVCLDELLLTGMTLCRYCLPSDQLIVKTRCQVVLREAKALLSEIVAGDLNTVFKVTKESLKLPIIPSNVNVLIDVLKDVLCALETNTNTALLALVVHCFSNSESPVEFLKEHFRNGSKGQCPCYDKSDGDISEDCVFVKEFDLYNERLLQIGSYAISSSLDQNRILTIRSGLASLEALDPHLVPALLLSPNSHHATLLSSCWRKEVEEIRDSVFLIVDPTAFAEKCKQMIHQKVLEIKKQNYYTNALVCTIINIGCVVEDFFSVYIKYEPDALVHREELMPLLANLNKVQEECKVVSNLLSSDDDIKLNVQMPATSKAANFDHMLIRLKLLYTMVNRINTLFQPKDDDDQLFVEEVYEATRLSAKNLTRTIIPNNGDTYTVDSMFKPANNSRSIFVRTVNARSGVNNSFVSSRLRKRLQMKKGEELSFSIQLDELLDDSVSGVKGSGNINVGIVNKHFNNVREQSILYNYSLKNRSSLRKAVLSRNFNVPSESASHAPETLVDSIVSQDGLMNENMSLQITEILDHMTNVSNVFDVTKPFINPTRAVISMNGPVEKNNASLNINNQTVTVEACLDETSATSNVSTTSSQPSNVTTFERLNDLDLVECKLSNLKYLQKETSL